MEVLSGAAEQGSLLRGSAPIWEQSPRSSPSHSPLSFSHTPRQWPPGLNCPLSWWLPGKPGQPAFFLALSPSSSPHGQAMWLRKWQISGPWSVAGCGARKGDPFSRQTQAALLNLAVALRPSWVGVCVRVGGVEVPLFCCCPPAPHG